MKPIGSRGLHIAAVVMDDGRMEKPRSLAARLEYCRTLPGEWSASYDAMIARLRRSGAADAAPKVGDVMADFALPDAKGKLRRLSDLVAERPAVLSFNRGSWCPYCQVEVTAWADQRPALHQSGARLIIITPEAGGRMTALADMAGQDAVVLCDLQMGVALRNGLAFPVGPEVLNEFLADGFDLAEVNGTQGGLLPVPATFLLSRDRVVHFAFVDPDFSQRAEPADVLAALKLLR